MNDNNNNPAIVGPDLSFNIDEENLSSQLNGLHIKKKVSVKWSDNIIDNENDNPQSPIPNPQSPFVKLKKKLIMINLKKYMKIYNKYI